MTVTTLDAWILMISKECSRNSVDTNFLFTIVAFTCWHIWKDRCKSIFNQKPPSPLQTIQVIVGEVELFLKAKALAHIPSVADCGWGAIGVVMRDHLGRCLAVRRKDIATQSVYAAEAMAIMEGCMLAQQHNMSQSTEMSNSVWVERPSSSFVRILNKDGLPGPL
ncbi:hypothetical protein ACFXTO_025225 [Malus domestica]